MVNENAAVREMMSSERVVVQVQVVRNIEMSCIACSGGSSNLML